MRLLIDSGADVNAQNAFGSTALMWSVSDPAKVRLLLDHGAQVNTVARSGRTALIVAAFTNPSAEVVRLLLAKGAKSGRHGHAACHAFECRDVSETIPRQFGCCSKPAPISNTPDTFIGLTPLMNAAGNRNVEAVKLLMAKGAAVNAVSKTEGLPKIQTGTVEFGGWTPLLMASAFGPPEAVKMLLDAGAKIDAQDYRGFTPLMLAAGTDRYDRRIVNMLLAHGADLRPTNHDGRNRARLGVEIRRSGSDPRTGRNAEGSGETRVGRGRAAGCPHRRHAQPSIAGAHERPVLQKEPAASPVMNSLRPTFAAAAARAKGIARWTTRRSASACCRSRRRLTRSRSKEQPRWAVRITICMPPKRWCAPAIAANRITDYLAANLAVSQGGDGGWHLPGYSRSPLQDSDFSRTAMAMRTLKTYGTPGRADGNEAASRTRQSSGCCMPNP